MTFSQVFLLPSQLDLDSRLKTITWHLTYVVVVLQLISWKLFFWSDFIIYEVGWLDYRIYYFLPCLWRWCYKLTFSEISTGAFSPLFLVSASVEFSNKDCCCCWCIRPHSLQNCFSVEHYSWEGGSKWDNLVTTFTSHLGQISLTLFFRNILTILDPIITHKGMQLLQCLYFPKCLPPP